jgi:tetratricopeptide (TPR) repeat protein
MRRFLTAVLLICTVFSLVPGQTESSEELFYDADFFFHEEEDYEEAAYLYRQMLLREPDNAHVKFLLGMSYNLILGQEHEAIPWFLEASGDISLKWKARKYKEKQAPHHTWFYLAEAYRKTNQLDKALEALEQFRSLKNFEKRYNSRITDDAIATAERAKIIRDAELNLEATCFGSPINTGEMDYNGVISADGNMLVWVNSRAFYEAVYMSQRKNGEWTIPVLITPQLISDGDLYPTGLSADGTTLLLVKSARREDSDIWYSKFDGMLWSPAEPLHGAINSKGEEDHASFSPDGNRIYFSSDRRGGQGGLDIWYSDRQANRLWGEPVNMGEMINTDQDETSAYVTPDGSRFIFSSRGHFNMGGFDIFRCDRLGEDAWGQPTNMGFPINTTGDNTFYVPLNDGMSGLYSRFTNECEGKMDLWYVRIIPEEGTISGDVILSKPIKGLSDKDFAIVIVCGSAGEEIEILYDAGTDTFKALDSEKKEYKVVSYQRK